MVDTELLVFFGQNSATFLGLDYKENSVLLKLLLHALSVITHSTDINLAADPV
ncbi:hypothetical protein ACRRTK_001519 [Alexandromys fortis]